MADSLDDFFAKKDKKRAKDKPKAAALSAEALVRELEEGSKQLDYPVRKDNKTSNVVELLGLDANDTDWRDFEDVEKRDYTGLKVKEMSLQDHADEEQRRYSEHIEAQPESTPWRIKDQESATNTDASNTTNSADAKQQNVSNTTKASDKPSDTSITAPVSSTSSASLANTLSSTTSEKTSSTTTDTQDAALDKPATTSDGPKDTESKDATAAGKDESKGDKPSAKAAYVPPHARMQNSDIKILEPSKLSKGTRTIGGRSGPIPNLQDEQSFPSLG